MSAFPGRRAIASTVTGNCANPEEIYRRNYHCGL